MFSRLVLLKCGLCICIVKLQELGVKVAPKPEDLPQWLVLNDRFLYVPTRRQRPICLCAKPRVLAKANTRMHV